MLLLLLLTLSFGVRGQTPSNVQGFNYHPIVRQYLEETSAAPTQQGPVVFPPSPSPPPQTLVVTARPRANNSQPASSGISSVYRPYKPFVPVPYGDKKYDFEQPTLPPIYKALSDHATDNLIKVTRKNEADIHRPKKDYDYNDLSSEDDQNQKYAFSYTVRDHKTGDDFSHSQHSSGSATNGEYRVKLPDGRTQIVSYTADENGYKADVRYDNDANDVNANDGNNAVKYDTIDNNYYNGNNAYKLADNNVGNDAIKYNPIDYNIVNNAYKYNTNNAGNNAIKYNSFDNYNVNNVNNNAYKHRSDNVYTHAIEKYLKNNDYDYSREEIPVKEEVKEYNDYSAEYNDKSNSDPNKFAIYETESKFVPTVRPSYDEIKDLFTKIHVTTPAYDFQATPTPDYNIFNNNNNNNDEKLVIIGNRYTDVRSTLANYNPTTPYFIPDPVTIKPILSQNYINRINKYLTFN